MNDLSSRRVKIYDWNKIAKQAIKLYEYMIENNYENKR